MPTSSSFIGVLLSSGLVLSSFNGELCVGLVRFCCSFLSCLARESIRLFLSCQHRIDSRNSAGQDWRRGKLDEVVAVVEGFLVTLEAALVAVRLNGLGRDPSVIWKMGKKVSFRFWFWQDKILKLKCKIFFCNIFVKYYPSKSDIRNGLSVTVDEIINKICQKYSKGLSVNR